MDSWTIDRWSVSMAENAAHWQGAACSSGFCLCTYPDRPGQPGQTHSLSGCLPVAACPCQKLLPSQRWMWPQGTRLLVSHLVYYTNSELCCGWHCVLGECHFLPVGLLHLHNLLFSLLLMLRLYVPLLCPCQLGN